MAINQQTSVGKDLKKKEPLCIVGGIADWCNQYGNRTIIWPCNPTSGYAYETKTKTLILLDLCTLMFTAALFTITKVWKLPKCLLKELKKEEVVHIYNGILFGHKKEWNFTICNNMDESRGYYIKWSKSNRERQIPHDFTHMRTLKNEIDKQNRSKLIDTETKLMLAIQKGWWGTGLERSTNWQLLNSHVDVKYSIGYIVSSSICMYSVRGVQAWLWWSLSKLYECLTIMLYTWK